MMRLFASLFALPLVLVIAGCGAEARSSDYYPLKVGTTWHYRAAGQTITLKVAAHESVDGVTCARVETNAGGRVAATEHISARDEGVFRYTMGGQKASPPVCFMKLPYKKGETWKVTSRIAGQDLNVDYTWDEEEIQVPAGKFQTIVTKTSEFMADGHRMRATIWYARGVGMVKTHMTMDGTPVVLELVKFEGN
jgi:hypothetical protein